MDTNQGCHPLVGVGCARNRLISRCRVWNDPNGPGKLEAAGVMIRLSSLSRRIGGGLADFSSPFKRPSVRVLDHLSADSASRKPEGGCSHLSVPPKSVRPPEPGGGEAECTTEFRHLSVSDHCFRSRSRESRERSKGSVGERAVITRLIGHLKTGERSLPGGINRLLEPQAKIPPPDGPAASRKV